MRGNGEVGEYFAGNTFVSVVYRASFRGGSSRCVHIVNVK